MHHSFVVGVTPEGKRAPLFVGTIGEARAFIDHAEKAGEVAGVYYPQLHLVESARPTSIQQVARKTSAPRLSGDPPPAPPEPRTSADLAPAAAPSPSTVAEGNSAAPAASAPAADKPPETREQYIARLEEATPAVLRAEAKSLGKNVLGMTNAKVRELLVAAKFSAPPAEQ